MKLKITQSQLKFALISIGACMGTLEAVQAVAQSAPAPNIPSGIYASQGHNYHWDNTNKRSCHIVGPAQLRLFVKTGMPSRGNAPFTPYGFQGGCLWPQGLYTPANNQGRVMYINGSQQICHVSPSLFKLLRQRFGEPLEGVSLADISKGLNNVGTCPNPG